MKKQRRSNEQRPAPLPVQPKSKAMKNVRNRTLRSKILTSERRAFEGARRKEQTILYSNQATGALEAEGLEQTYKYKQEQLLEEAPMEAVEKLLNLELNDFGPYTMDVTRNGRYMAIGGEKGHLASFDRSTGRLLSEVHLKENIRCVRWLHNESMLAVAQKKYVYMYDNTGAEIHCLRKHIDVQHMEFLPYHFLLATIGGTNTLIYHDTSTGAIVAEHKTKTAGATSLRQNPYNGVMLMGHGNGLLTMWSPSMGTPLAKILCHKGPVTAVATDREGRYMVISGLDGQMKVWDVRKFGLVHAYHTPSPASTVDVSQTGLLSVGYGSHVQVWKDALMTKQTSPYMTHHLHGRSLSRIQFCPYDDVLFLGHSQGLSTMLVPGAGEANIATFEENPYETKRQRQETEVKRLLEKIQPDMISLDPTFIARFKK